MFLWKKSSGFLGNKEKRKELMKRHAYRGTSFDIPANKKFWKQCGDYDSGSPDFHAHAEAAGKRLYPGGERAGTGGAAV